MEIKPFPERVQDEKQYYYCRRSKSRKKYNLPSAGKAVWISAH